MRSARWALPLFLALEAPEGRYVDGEGGYGIAAEQSLALVTDVGICAWGGPEAEELLDGLLDAWRARGRPSERNLEITVSYDGEKPRVEHEWQE